MALLDSINEKLAYTGEQITAIGEAANGKGAGINLETDALAEWPEKISAIPSPTLPEPRISTEYPDRMGFSGYLLDTYTFPTAIGDNILNNSFTTAFQTSNNNQTGLFNGVRKFVIPEYFNGFFIDGYGVYCSAEELVIMGVDLQCSNRTVFTYLNSISYPNRSSSVYCPAGNFATSMSIDCPNMIEQLNIIHDAASTTPKLLSINAPLATTILKTPGTGTGSRMFYGTNTLPSVRSMGEWDLPIYNNTTFYFPSITTFNNNATFYSGITGRVDGTMDLYVGPNLTNCSWSTARYTVVAPYLTIHIPEGDTATKTTLDTKEITYVQDYII